MQMQQAYAYACIYENYQSESVLFAFVKRDVRKKSVDDA